jgi:hypothetical protein
MKIDSRGAFKRSLTLRMGAGVMSHLAHTPFTPSCANLLLSKSFESRSSHV